MIDFVLDASALLDLIIGRNTAPELRRRVLTGRGAAPALIDIEVLHTLRRLNMRGQLGDDAAGSAAMQAADAPIDRMPHGPLLHRVWELRGSVSAYDAAYVALAEKLGVPLLTCDKRLAGANGHQTEILAFPAW